MKNTNIKLLGLLLMCQLLIVPFQISNAAGLDTTVPSIQTSSTSPAAVVPSVQPTAQPATTMASSPAIASPQATTLPPITTTPPTTTTTPPTTATPSTTAAPPSTTATPSTTTTTTTTEAPTNTTPPPTSPPATPSTTEATTATSAPMTSQTQPMSTSTLAPSATTPPAMTTSPALETSASTAATPATTSQPDVPSSSTSVSAATTAVPKPSVSEVTTASSSATTASPATTAAPSTTTAKSAYPTKQPEKPFQVVLVVGDASNSDVYCEVNITCTFGNIAPEMKAAFDTVPGYLYIREGTSTANRRKRDTRFSVYVLFDFQKLNSLTKEARSEEMYKALQNLNNNTNIGVNMSWANTTAVTTFAAANVCSVPDVCTGGYSCKQALCHHMCENYDCGNNGVCNTVVNADGSASAQCVCNSDDEHTYSGDRCQEEATSKAKVASIVGGVLGAFCALFLIVIIFLAYRLWNKGGGSKREYQLGGYSNNGYADHEFAMKNVATDNP